MKPPSPNGPCPCGGVKYKKCCGPLHAGAVAVDAVSLMRSRYSAYACGLVDYVMNTTHPECPEFRFDRTAWAAELRRFCASTDFVGLQIVASQATTVTFRASLRQGGRDASFTEMSQFTQRDGRWLYRSGIIS